MRVIGENLERCQQFYNSDYYQLINQQSNRLVNSIFDYLCQDPDACDETLYAKLGEKFDLLAKKTYLLEEVNGTSIRLSSDIVCGRKQIVRYHHNDFEKWIADYELVRRNLNLHFIWPVHKLPTINTYRYSVYLDRIDCLLLDLKYYFKGHETPMSKAYQQELTAIWLEQFESNFQYFIDKMKLNKFVDANYEVLDISNGQQTPLTKILSRKEISESLSDYMSHLLRLNRLSRFD